MLMRRKIALVGLSFSLCLISTASFAEEPATGAKKAELCFGCHGEDGISLSPTIPNLAGQKSEYLLKAIGDFKKGARKNSLMQSVISGVSDDDAKEIVNYFSNL